MARLLAAVAVFISALVVVPVAPGEIAATNAVLRQTAPPTLTVAPDGPHAPGAEVTVTISGVPPNSYWVLAQCRTDAPTGCGPEWYAGGEQSVITRPITVRRTIVTPDGLVDCAVEPCEVRLLGSEAAPAPLPVDPTATITPPTISLDPGGPFADNEVIEVTGAGFSQYSEYQIVQCAGFECGPMIGALYTDENGDAGPARIPLARFVAGVDCAATTGSCRLWVGPPQHVDELTTTPLEFDPDAPPLPRPTATVAPSTGLVHDQSVTVSVNDSTADFITVRQCRIDDTGCAWGRAVNEDVAPGDLSIELFVSRRVGSNDCGVDGCDIVVSADPFPPIRVPIAFDISVPPPPLPTMTIRPDRGLRDLQTVEVLVEPVQQYGFVEFSLCTLGEPSDRRCDYIGEAGRSAAGSGPLSVDVTMPRLLADGQDCADVGCELVAFVYDFDNSVDLHQPVSFDPALPLAPPPAMQVLPATGLFDNQQVEIRTKRLRPQDFAVLRQCADTGSPFTSTNCSDETYLDTGTGGDRIIHRAVRRTFTTLDRNEVDCIVTRCVLVLTTGRDELVAPLAFDPTGVANAFPEQLECVSWPTQNWPTAPLPEGVDVADLDDLVAAAAQDDRAGQSLVVIHGGELVYEWYDDGTDLDTLQPSFSVAKSVTGTLTGMLIDDGLLDLDGPAPVPEWSDPDDPRHDISVRNLLNMNSGLEWDESYSFQPGTDIIDMFASGDIGGYVADKPLVAPPGTSHNYSTGTSSLLARILAQQSGQYGPDFEALMYERLFTPLGIDAVGLAFDGTGVWYGGSQANMATRDFARLGLLYLRGGVWEDEPLLPDGWAEFVRTPSPTNDGYGSQFWVEGGGRFSMVGLFGQRVLIAPDLDLVVAVNNSAASTGEVAALFEAAARPECAGALSLLNDDAAFVAPSASITIDVLANDPGRGEAMAPSTLTLADEPRYGDVEIVDGAMRYTNTSGASGSDRFTYYACNAPRICGEASVELSIARTQPFGTIEHGVEVSRRAARCSLGDC